MSAAELIDDDVYEHALGRGELLELRGGDAEGAGSSTLTPVQDQALVIYDPGFADWANTQGVHSVNNASSCTEVQELPATSWWARAACRGLPTEWWFPERGDNESVPLARSICAGCAVVAECLEAALAEERPGAGGRFGIRAGLSPDQRQRVGAGASA